MAQTSDVAPRERWRGFPSGGVLAAVLSSLACALAWLVAHAVGVSLVVPPLPFQAGEGPHVLPLEDVVGACVALAVLATVLFAALTRLTRRPVEVLLALGALALLAGLVMVVRMEADVPTRVTLGVMCVLAAVFVFGPVVGRVVPVSVLALRDAVPSP